MATTAPPAVIDRVIAQASRAAQRCRGVPPGISALETTLDALAGVESLGEASEVYFGSLDYGGLSVPSGMLDVWGYMRGLSQDDMNVICCIEYYTNVRRTGPRDALGLTVQYAGMTVLHRHPGSQPIEAPSELLADFLFNAVTHLGLRTPAQVREFLTTPLDDGAALDLLLPSEVRLMVASGQHLRPPDDVARDTTALVRNVQLFTETVLDHMR